MPTWMDLPYEIKDVTPEEDKLIKKCVMGALFKLFCVLCFVLLLELYKGHSRTFVKCGKSGYVMPGAFKKHAPEIYNVEVRPDDVWVITFPRSGTTWTQEMIWLLKNDLNYNASKEIPLYDRFPMLEITSMIPDIAFELIKTNFMNLANFQGLSDAVKTPSWKRVERTPSPRFIKTHLPLSMLPPKLLETAKVVYVARDPRDVAVSYYYLHKMVAKSLMRANFHHYWEAFKRDLLPWTPIIAHTNEAWQQRHHPNLHLVFYEDLIKDLPKEISRISKFLGKDYSDIQIKELAHYLSFNNLRKNGNVNNTTGNGKNEIQFIRKGEAGGWKSHFDQEMVLEAEEFLISRLQGLDLVYPSFGVGETTHL